MKNKDGRSPHYLRHIRVDDFRSEEPFSPPQRDMSGVSSGRNRDVHGPKLERDLAEALAVAHDLVMSRDPALQVGREGIYLEVESSKESKLSDLNWKSKNIRFGAVRANADGSEIGALFIPASSEMFLAKKIQEYAYENTPKAEPKHEAKFASVETFRAATIESLWTDQRPMPTDATHRIWWECWCWRDLTDNLFVAAARLSLRVSERRLIFPEFDVIPVYANSHDIARLLQNTDAVEELRQASDTPSFFMTTARREQIIWIDDLASRIEPPSATSPAVCILDNGVAHSHPLIAPALMAQDCLTVQQDWGVDDHEKGGHGTNMAGTILYGDLTYLLADQRTVALTYALESVKFLPPPGHAPHDTTNYGAITQAAVALAEIARPDRPRIFCMAVTNLDVSGERPTSWSAALDQICAGGMPGDEPNEVGDPPSRLFFVSAGNVPDASDPDEISDQDEFPVEDPAQAWNAIAVGGFTDKVDIAPEDELPGWKGVAGVGDHSPYSRISTDWEHSRTAVKPEIVFEAGNKAISPSGNELLSGVDSLSLLTTSKEFLTNPLTTFWATSAATAQAAGMAAAIMAHHPELWPETVRALIVHSAEWTPAMLARLRACKGRKKDCIALARRFGYGVPRLDRALASAQHDLALLAQTHIRPFKRERKPDESGRLVLGAPTFDEVHYYELPWPKEALEALDDKNVRLKVTLSYFVDPSPGEASPVTPSRYQSYGFRYELKRSTETADIFHQRINRLERGDEKLPPAAPDPRWTFGIQSVAAGSLHCDVWIGPAIELASRNLMAVYPVSGWWRYRTHLKRYNSRARYGLAISITSDDQEVELYTEIANIIGIGIETAVEI